MTLLHAAGLSVSLGRKTILQDVTFSLQPGTLVGLLGPNGSGKTTLLRAISGLIRYTGSLSLYGKEVSTWRTRSLARQVAIVRQGAQLLFDFTVQEMVLLGLSPHKRLLEGTSSADLNRVGAALAQVDLANYQQRSILVLSGGERQRVFLAQALAQDAGLLLLDEPTTHLDVHHQHGFLRLVCQLVDEGRSAISVFHDIELAARFCSHLLVVDGGRLVASGAPQAVVTEELMASVFKMQARVTRTGRGMLHIAYEKPLSCTAP